MHLRFEIPIRSWDEGAPLGNGLLGAILWGNERELYLWLDQATLWDERTPPEYPSACAFSSTLMRPNLARFAAETGHPSAADRRQEIEGWNAEVHDIDSWTFRPLHQAAMSVLRVKPARAGNVRKKNSSTPQPWPRCHSAVELTRSSRRLGGGGLWQFYEQTC